MAAIVEIEPVKARLKAIQKKYGKPSKYGVVVGYTQSYAIYVHENLEAHHPVGQAKYLEQPARQLRQSLSRQIKTAMDRGLTMEDGLILAGLRLQRESQKLCPVDTGALKASAFTAKVNEAATAAAAAFAKSEAIRKSALTSRANAAKKKKKKAAKKKPKQGPKKKK